MSDPVQSAPIQSLYESLAAKHPQIAQRGFEGFAQDMQDENNLNSLYQSLSKQVKPIADRGFEGFKSDMWSTNAPITPTTPLVEPESEQSEVKNPEWDNKSGWDKFTTGIESGWENMKGGIKYTGGVIAEGMDKIDGVEDWDVDNELLQSAKKNFADAPKGDGILFDVGSFMPQMIGIAAATLSAPVTGGTSLAASPTIIGGANIGLLVASSAGSAMNTYDEYIGSKGQESNDLARIGVGVGAGAAEYFAERIGLDRYMPKGSMAKAFSKYLSGVGSDVAEELGKKALKQNPSIGGFLKRTGKNMIEEGSEEALTETGNILIESMYRDKEDVANFDEWSSRLKSSFQGGALMGGMISPISYGSQAAYDKKMQGNNPIPENQPQLTVNPDVERQALIQQQADIAEGLKHESGNIIKARDNNGNQMFVKSGDLSDPDGMLQVINEDGTPAGEDGWIHASKLNDHVVATPEAFIQPNVDAINAGFSQQNQEEQYKADNSMNYNGQTLIRIPDGQGKGEKSEKWIDANGQMIDVPNEIIQDWEKSKENQPQNNESVTGAPDGDNGLKAEAPKERKIVTQSFKGKTIDIAKDNGFDEVIPSDKMPLEKALPILETYFKDHKKFKLEVDQSEVENRTPGENDYDDDIVEKKVVIKSIKIIPKQTANENNTSATESNPEVVAETKPQATAEPGGTLGTEELTVPVQPELTDKQKAYQLITGKPQLDATDAKQAELIPGEIALKAINGQMTDGELEAYRNLLQKDISVNNLTQQTKKVSKKEKAFTDNQDIENKSNSESSQLNQLQNEESEKSLPEVERQSIANEGENTPQAQQGQGNEKGLEENVNIINGYKFTNTPTLSEKDGIIVEPLSQVDSDLVSNAIYIEGSPNILHEGARNEGGGWFSIRNENGKILHNYNKGIAVFLDHKKGGRLGVVIQDFIKNNSADQPSVETVKKPEVPVSANVSTDQPVTKSLTADPVAETWMNKPNAISGAFPKSIVQVPVFHGSRNQFDDFDESLIGKNDPGVFGKGIYLSENKSNASQYGGADYANIKAYEVDIQKPYIVNFNDESSVREARKLLSGKEIPTKYDGVIVYESGKMNEIVVRSKSQLKRITTDEDIWKAYDEGKYKQAVIEGKLTEEQAREIVESSGIKYNSVAESGRLIDETTKTDQFPNVGNMVDQAAQEVNLNPTKAQKEAGNYKKGHVTVQGMDITIENPKGSVRSGTDEDGKAWETEMKSHYGYFKGTTGKDGDHIDTFIGDNSESDAVFVVDQNHPKTGAFDESKVMLGYNTPEEAKAAYMANYEPGWNGFGSITPVQVDDFKTWLNDGARQRKPFAEYKDTPAPVEVAPVFTEGDFVIFTDAKGKTREAVFTGMVGEKAGIQISGTPTKMNVNPERLTKDESKTDPPEQATPVTPLEKVLETRTEKPKEVKAPYQMTRDEYTKSVNAVGYWAETSAISDHNAAVRKALEQGVDVSDEVLNDYPELKYDTLRQDDVIDNKEDIKTNTTVYDTSSDIKKPILEVLSDGKKEAQEKKSNVKNDNFVKNNSDGRSSNSENAGLQPEGIVGSSRNDEVSIILRGNGEGGTGALRGSQSNKSEQENQLKKYAEDKGIWLTNDQILSLTSIKYPSGKEADIYIDKSNSNVIKVVNYQKYSNTPLDFFNNRISAFNELFNGTNYSIIGFTETDKGFSFILSQPFIKGSLLGRLATSEAGLDEQQQRIADYMKDKFGMNPAGLDAYENDNFRIEDVHLKNVIQGEDGNLYFIDVIPTDKRAVEKQSTPLPEEKQADPIKKLESENKSTLPKIPVGKIFSNDVQTIPRDARAEADKLIEANTFDQLPVETVNISDIIPSQKNVTISNIKEVANVDLKPQLLKFQGKYYVLDGHHRISNRILEGETTVEANVFDEDANLKEANKPIINEEGKIAKDESKPEKITDFGEVISGAKKDRFKEMAKMANDATVENLIANPLSKVFPEPDYKKLVESGELTPSQVSAIKVFREQIPSKPKKAYKVRRWAEQANMYIQLISDLASKNGFFSETEGKTFEDFMNRFVEKYPGDLRTANEMIFKKKFYDYAGLEYNASGYEFYKSRDKEKSFAILKSGISKGWFTTDTEAFEALKNLIDNTKGKAKETKFNVYQDRSTKECFIGYKAGSEVVRLKEGFTTGEEARIFLNENKSLLEEQLQQLRDIPDERKASNSPRIGTDYRNGKDVTPEMFTNTFGFRGVQFGNYVENERRVQDLNEAYDALMDLANVLNIPAKAISLNGELGMAFGARGSGKYAAHYESGQIVINITKTRGAGSMAHEWFHAVDNYFERARDNKNDFITDAASFKVTRYGKKESDNKLRIEVLQAFADLNKAVSGTGLYKRSRKLDTTRSKPYWGTTIEMNARAFEWYVKNRIESQGGQSDYLANIQSETHWDVVAQIFGGTEGSYPYPTEKEAKIISDAFDHVFDVIETKEENGNVALFRIIGETGAGNLDREEEEVTTRLDNLAVAREMESSGKDAKTISLATGWEKGADGKWRYEVPDFKITDKGLRKLWDYIPKNKALHLYDIIEDRKQTKQLFNEYPDFFDIKVYFDDIQGGIAHWDASNQAIVLSNKYYKQDPSFHDTNIESTILHEIQHAIQDVEGFAKGGNTEMFKGERKAYIDRLQAAKNALHILKSENKETARQELEALGLTNKNISNLTEDYIRIYPESTIKSIVQTEEGILDPLKSYKRLAGEVESRNVQTRMNMTPEERRNVLLQETEDVSREDQIVLMDGLGVSNLEGDNSIESQVAQLESESKYQTQINYLDNTEAADYLEGRIPDRFIPEIRNTPFQGMTAAGEIFINPKSRKNKSNVLVTWVHEKTHIEISRQYPDRQERQDYFTWAYNEIRQEEIQRIIPEEYWNDPINLQAEEYFAFLNEGISENGNIDPLITNEVKLATFELLNGFTTLKTIQDARTRSINQAQLGRTGRNTYEGSTERNRLSTDASLRENGEVRFDRSLRQDDGRENGKELDKSLPLNDYLFQAKQSVSSKLAPKQENTILINGTPRPTLNSNGKPIANSEEGIRNFYEWFGDSKVVDAEGRPLVVYHGTDNDFNEFEPTTPNFYAITEGTYFFTDNEKVAAKFGDNVMPVYLNIDNPTELDGRSAGRFSTWSLYDDSGNYGFIVKNSDTGGGFATEYAVENASQIKSATGNNGSFNPDDNNINFKKETPTTPLERKLNERSELLDVAGNAFKERPVDKPTTRQVLQSMRDMTQEKDGPISRWQKTIINDMGGKLTDDANPFRDKKLAPGRLQTLTEQFFKDYITPLVDVAARISKEVGKQTWIEPYLIAKHAPERNASIRAAKLEEWKDKGFNLTKWAKENQPSDEELQAKIDEQVAEGNYPSEQEIDEQTDELMKQDFSGIMPLNQDKNGNVINPEFEEDPDALANAIVDQFESIVSPELVNELNEKRKAIADAILEAQVKAKTISQAEADNYKSRWKHYVPLRGWMDDASKRYTYTKSNNGSGTAVKHAGGRGSLAESPLGYLHKLAFRSISDQVDSEIKQSLLRFIGNNYSPEFKKMYQVKQAYFVKDGIDPETGETLWTITTDKPSKEDLDSGNAIMEAYNEHLKFRTAYQAKEHEVVISRADGSAVVIVFDRTDPNLLEVAQSFNNNNVMFQIGNTAADNAMVLNAIVEQPIPGTKISMRNFTNFFKSMLTQFNLRFPITNFPRDFAESNIDSYIVNGKTINLKTNKQALSAIDSYLRNAPDRSGLRDEVNNFYENGGTTGYTHDKTPVEYQKEMLDEINMLVKNGLTKSRTRRMEEWLTRYNQRFEDSVRFSVYMNARKLGYTIKDAAFRSRNATVDFNIRGKLSPVLGTMYGFFEVSMNSLAKTGDYFSGGGGTLKTMAKDPKVRKRAIKVATAFVMLGFLEAMLNDWITGDDDDKENDYYNRSRWMRHNYINIPVPIKSLGLEKLYFSIALPPGWRTFKGLGAVTYDYLIGQRGKVGLGESIGNAAMNFVDGFSPVPITSVYQNGKWHPESLIIPMALKPWYEVAINENYMGSRIAKEPFTEKQRQEIANSALGKDNVNVAAKFFTDLMFKAGGGDSQLKVRFEDDKRKEVSWWMDWNPSKIEHLVTGYGGGTLDTFSDVMKTGWNMIQPDKKVDFADFPFVNAFIRKTPAAKWTVISDYYKLFDDVKGLDSVEKEYEKQAIESGDLSSPKADKYRDVAGSNYLQTYQTTLDVYKKLIDTLSDQVDYKTGEGTDTVIDMMKQATQAIDELKTQNKAK